MSLDAKFDAACSLLLRLDPRNVEKNLENVCRLIQGDTNDNDDIVLDLLSHVDTPLKVLKCPDLGKPFLCCDFNRDGDSFRSPWSNKYVPQPPPQEEAPPFPSPMLRQLEVKANDSFDIYRDLYYEGQGVSSVYLWNTDMDEEEEEAQGADTLEKGFAGVVLIKKESENGQGKWDSVNVFEVVPQRASQCLYRVTTSVTLDLQSAANMSLTLAGSLTRQTESVQSITTNAVTDHLVHIGTLIELAENNVRNTLQQVYFGRLCDVFVKDVRTIGSVGNKQSDDALQAKVIEGISGL